MLHYGDLLGHIWYVILMGMCYNAAILNGEAHTCTTGHSLARYGKQNRQEWIMPLEDALPLELEYRTTEHSVKNHLHS